MRFPLLAIVVMLFVVITPKVGADDPPNKNIIVFEGRVLKIGARMPASGLFIFYRLAKYHIDHVCSGIYPENEIVVDHLSLFTAEELEGVKVGDRVCVAVEARKEIGSLTYENGLREKSAKVDTFYIGGEVVRVKDSCECAKEAIYYLNNRSKNR
jgi:hypothetical protein